MPEFRIDDTIAAVATPVGEGGISVIRVSGPDALSFASTVFRPKKKGNLSDFLSHTIHAGSIHHNNGECLDQVLVSLFRAPHSYTGEEVVEISSHGGMAVTKLILELLVKKGARHAEPGEFTRRAFLNGKIDLTQAEAVLDLIKARSERSLEIAVRQLAGSLSQKLKLLKDELMALYAHMEAFLDFPDEHLEVYTDEEFGKRFGRLKEQIGQLIATFKRGSLLREGAMAVLVGKPNVGKSSLFNVLLERDRALVSEYPGTTRDLLEESLDIEGFAIRLVDTAGLAPFLADHPLDQISMERTRRVLAEAQLFLYVVDGSAPLDEADRQVFAELSAARREEDGNLKPVLVVANKSDLMPGLDLEELARMTEGVNILGISTKTRAGLVELEKQIASAMLGGISPEGEQITRLRHKHALERAFEALTHAEESFQRRESLEFVVLDLKSAIDRLRELIGEIYSEDLLDVIFSEFCIGK